MHPSRLGMTGTSATHLRGFRMTEFPTDDGKPELRGHCVARTALDNCFSDARQSCH
ncbi:protein of unknown function [Burkholderia multivorans]